MSDEQVVPFCCLCGTPHYFSEPCHPQANNPPDPDADTTANENFVTVEATLFWDRDEPDGSECALCGDQPLLTMWRGFASVEKIANRVSTDVVLCDSCHEELMESDDSD